MADLGLYTLPGRYRSERVRVLALTVGGALALSALALAAAAQEIALAFGFHPRLGPPLYSAPEGVRMWLAPIALLVAAIAVLALFRARLRSASPVFAAAAALAYLAYRGPLYLPWAYFDWSSRLGSMGAEYGDLASRAGHVMLAGLGLALALVFVAHEAAMKRLPKRGDTHGSARWAERDDVVAANLLDRGAGVVLGTWKSDLRREPLRAADDRHVIVIAPSGTGKTTSLVVPTLLEYPGSVVVLDIKGELWQLTAGHRKRVLGQKTLRFDPTDFHATTARWNPLLSIQRGREDVKGARALADVLVDPEGRKDKPDFWAQSAHALLMGTILHVLYAGQPKTLATCARLLSDPSRPIRQTLLEMLHTRHDVDGELAWVNPATGRPTATHPVVAGVARELLDTAKETMAGILKNAQAYLSLWKDPVVGHATETSDFTPDDLMHGEEPVSLYLTIPPAQIQSVRVLLRMLLNQVGRDLTNRMAPTDPSRPTYRHKLLLVLDEFAALGRLDFFQHQIAYLRGFGIRAFLVLQTWGQLHAAYGKEESISPNCMLQVALGAADLETAKIISAMTGRQTVHHQRESRSPGKGLLSSRVNVSDAEQGRPLLTPDEVLRLPKERLLIFPMGHRPLLAWKAPYFEDPSLEALARTPAPAGSDRIQHDWSEWLDHRAEVPRPEELEALQGEGEVPS